jgi:quercetin 2,3-dioxygenase
MLSSPFFFVNSLVLNIGERGEITINRSLILFDKGDRVTVQAGEEGFRFLLVSGRPLQEPVAWHGPIVMNTQQALIQAFRDLQNGTFIQ